MPVSSVQKQVAAELQQLEAEQAKLQRQQQRGDRSVDVRLRELVSLIRAKRALVKAAEQELARSAEAFRSEQSKTTLDSQAGLRNAAQKTAGTAQTSASRGQISAETAREITSNPNAVAVPGHPPDVDIPDHEAQKKLFRRFLGGHESVGSTERSGSDGAHFQKLLQALPKRGSFAPSTKSLVAALQVEADVSVDLSTLEHAKPKASPEHSKQKRTSRSRPLVWASKANTVPHGAISATKMGTDPLAPSHSSAVGHAFTLGGRTGTVPEGQTELPAELLQAAFLPYGTWTTSQILLWMLRFAAQERESASKQRQNLRKLDQLRLDDVEANLQRSTWDQKRQIRSGIASLMNDLASTPNAYYKSRVNQLLKGDHEKSLTSLGELRDLGKQALELLGEKSDQNLFPGPAVLTERQREALEAKGETEFLRKYDEQLSHLLSTGGEVLEAALYETAIKESLQRAVLERHESNSPFYDLRSFDTYFADALDDEPQLAGLLETASSRPLVADDLEALNDSALCADLEELEEKRQDAQQKAQKVFASVGGSPVARAHAAKLREALEGGASIAIASDSIDTIQSLMNLQLMSAQVRISEGLVLEQAPRESKTLSTEALEGEGLALNVSSENPIDELEGIEAVAALSQQFASDLSNSATRESALDELNDWLVNNPPPLGIELDAGAIQRLTEREPNPIKRHTLRVVLTHRLARTQSDEGEGSSTLLEQLIKPSGKSESVEAEVPIEAATNTSEADAAQNPHWGKLTPMEREFVVLVSEYTTLHAHRHVTIESEIPKPTVSVSPVTATALSAFGAQIAGGAIDDVRSPFLLKVDRNALFRSTARFVDGLAQGVSAVAENTRDEVAGTRQGIIKDTRKELRDRVDDLNPALAGFLARMLRAIYR